MTININEVSKEIGAFYTESGWVDKDGNLIGCHGKPLDSDGKCPKCKENCI